MMLPLPLSTAVASRPMSRRSAAVPSPLMVTSSLDTVPVASMLPLPGSATVRCRLLIPVTAMFPAPSSLRPSSAGTVTVTNTGLFALSFPGVVPTTSRRERTCVVTRASRLLSAWTITDCVPPTRTRTLLAPARTTPLKGGSERACVDATPEPVPGPLERSKKIGSTTTAMRIATTRSAPSAVKVRWTRLSPVRRWIAVRPPIASRPRRVGAGEPHARARTPVEHGRGVLECADSRHAARRLDEAACRFGLRPHGSRVEAQLAQPARRRLAQRRRVRLAPVCDDVRHVGEHQERRGVEPLGEQGGREVLVDHRLHSFDAPTAVRDDRDAASAGADHERLVLHQPADRLELEDPPRVGRGDDAPPSVAVGSYRPSPRLGEHLGGGRLVHGPDRLRWMLERRVGRIDLDLRQQRGDLARRQDVHQLLLQEVTDHPLALGAEDVERIRLHTCVGL